MTDPLVHGLLLGICGLLLALGRAKKAGFVLIVAGIFWVYLCSTPAFVSLLRDGLERHAVNEALSHAQADAIVVLGGGGAELDETGEDAHWVRANDVRAAYAAQLYAERAAPVVIISGVDDAPIIRARVVRLGVPASRVITEESSTSTHENARFLEPILHAKGIHAILLVTSAAHMERAAGAISKRGFSVTMAPAMIKGDRRAFRDRWKPHWQLTSEAGRYLHEYVGLAAYRLWGWA